jgi:hypothetical protein
MGANVEGNLEAGQIVHTFAASKENGAILTIKT